jgi:hypothetical protein
MSGGGGGVIIIQNLVESGKFTPEECAKLREIQARSIVRCSWLDSRRVAKIVKRGLRRT